MTRMNTPTGYVPKLAGRTGGRKRKEIHFTVSEMDKCELLYLLVAVNGDLVLYFGYAFSLF